MKEASQSIIKNRRVRLSTAAAMARGEKSVELLEDDGVVNAIRLRCACGEETVIELDYAPPSSGSGAVASPAAEAPVPPVAQPNPGDSPS